MAFWVTFFGSLFAVSLGVALIFNQEVSRSLLGKFRGAYWISAGLISLRWRASGERGGKLTFIIGLIGILAGLMHSEQDRKGSKAMLNAAGLTYMAAAVTSILRFLYYISVANRRG